MIATTSSCGADWPVLKRYKGAFLRRVALPLGGIGTGTVSLGGRGDWRDWEVMNRPAKGWTPDRCFFAIRVADDENLLVTRALEGPIDRADYEGGFGTAVRNHGLPRFAECAFETAYPLAKVLLSDPDVPAQVHLEAFNPLLPTDAQRSGIPAAICRVVVSNPTQSPLQISICGNVQNFIGHDGTNGKALHNRNEWRQEENLSGVFAFSDGVSSDAEQWGTMALALLDADDVDVEISHRTAWAKRSWGDSLLDFWDDFSGDGRLENRESDVDDPVASLCAQFSLQAGESRALTFVMAWHFPNRMTWTPIEAAADCSTQDSADGLVLDAVNCSIKNAADSLVADASDCLIKTAADSLSATAAGCCDNSTKNINCIGNFYTAQWESAWDVCRYLRDELPALEAGTVAFVRALCESDFPAVVKEAALFNLSTLRSQTCFRTPDGHFFGWEGCGDKSGCCHGTCTHVWNYEQATAFLFGSLSRSMREVEFQHATDGRGLMSFRVSLPLGQAGVSSAGETVGAGGDIAAADGQMGCLMKLYRDWKLCGDDDWLRSLWPQARRALEFCWIAGGWDADRDGVMEGCQHNTMDVEYFGPNPQMQSWYLGALRATEEMAKYFDEPEFAHTCHNLFERGRDWTAQNLWNGEYYEHQIWPPHDASKIAAGLRLGAGAENLDDPELQLGAGCLVDGLVGQYMAHLCGLGYILPPEQVGKMLDSIRKYNRRSHLRGHFNHLRTFALGDEAALLMASYPRGNRPKRPFPYYNEVMTGFEYTAAVGMLQEGRLQNGLQTIADIRARYDGQRRNPFDEAECGHHYARAMASWTAILVLSGFQYSAVIGEMRFARADQAVQWFWSSGDAWGTLQQSPKNGGIDFSLRVEAGTLGIKVLCIGNGVFEWSGGALNAGQTVEGSIKVL